MRNITFEEVHHALQVIIEYVQNHPVFDNKLVGILNGVLVQIVSNQLKSEKESDDEQEIFDVKDNVGVVFINQGKTDRVTCGTDNHRQIITSKIILDQEYKGTDIYANDTNNGCMIRQIGIDYEKPFLDMECSLISDEEKLDMAGYNDDQRSSHHGDDELQIPEDLASHARIDAPQTTAPLNDTFGIQTGSVNHGGNVIIQCTVCDRKCKGSTGLRVHMKSHKKKRSNNTRKSHPAKKRKQKCRHCGDLFESKNGLIQHMNDDHYEKQYRCQTCGKFYKRHALLKKHMLLHSKEKLYACSICEKKCRYKHQLKFHMSRHDGGVRCDVCQKSFQSTAHLTRHKVIHGERKYKCPQCDKTFFKEISMHSHFRTHTGEMPYTCEYCGLSLRSYSILWHHKQKHKKETLPRCERCHHIFSRKCSMENHVCKGEYRGVCESCGNLYTSVRRFQKHLHICPMSNQITEDPLKDLNRVHNLQNQCDLCHKSFQSKTHLIRHKAIHGEKPFKCPHCDKTFFQEKYLNNHITTHTGETPFSCGPCELSFRSYSLLWHHKEKHHNGGKCILLSCAHCDLKFTNKSQRNTHVRHNHKTQKTENEFICQFCGRTFKTNGLFLRHCQKCFKSHVKDIGNDQSCSNDVDDVSIQMPHECDICNKRFPGLRHLKRHKQLHGEKRFKCPYCEKQFFRKVYMENHIRKHTGEMPYSCDVCGQSFTSAGLLWHHKDTLHKPKKSSAKKKVQSNKKLLQCPHCDQSFIQKNHLDNHVRKHTGEMPYACDMCDKYFRTSKMRIYHNKKYHTMVTDNKPAANVELIYQDDDPTVQILYLCTPE